MTNRVSDLKTFDDTMDAVGWGEIAYPDVNWRYLIMPSSPLPGDGKSFDPVRIEPWTSTCKLAYNLCKCIALQTQMQQMVNQGESDAKAAVAKNLACADESASGCKDVCSRPQRNFVPCSIDKVIFVWFAQS